MPMTISFSFTVKPERRQSGEFWTRSHPPAVPSKYANSARPARMPWIFILFPDWEN